MIVVIIGLGSVAHKHIAAIRSVHPAAIIYALRSKKNSEEVEGVINIYDISGLNNPPDFILIANPTFLHAATIRKYASTGIPLMIEKPLYHELKGLDVLLGESRSLNNLTYVACNLRFHPAIKFLKEKIKGKRINEVNIYCGSYLPDWRPGKDYKSVYSSKQEEGGGVHLDLIHEIDYCCWIFGIPGDSLALKRSVSSLKINAVDYADYNLIYPEFVANITLNYYRKDAKRSIEIIFDSETWNIDLLKCEIIDSNAQVVFKEEFNMMDTYSEQMQYFTSLLKGKKEPMNNIYEAYEVLKICLANE